MNESEKNIETCLPESILAEAAVTAEEILMTGCWDDFRAWGIGLPCARKNF